MTVGRLVEVAGQHQLKGQLICTGGYAKAHAGFDAQNFAAAVKGGPNLVKLVIQRNEVAKRTIVVILLEGKRIFIVKVIGDSRCGNEFEASKAAL